MALECFFFFFASLKLCLTFAGLRTSFELAGRREGGGGGGGERGKGWFSSESLKQLARTS